MTIIRLVFCLISVLYISGCTSTNNADEASKEITSEQRLPEGAERLQAMLIQQCVDDIRKGVGEDKTALRCYSRKLEQLVDLAVEEMKKDKTEGKGNIL